MTIFLCFLLGILLGIISGIIPGLNVFITLTLLYPFLLQLDPISILVLFVTIASIDQYFGSVSAILFATPGSSTSLPALEEGHELFRQGKADEAIMFSAIGSFFASIFAVIMIFSFIPFMNILYQMFGTHLQSLLLFFASIAIILFSRNSWWISAFLFLFGNFLGHIGYREDTGKLFFTFDFSTLYNGLPFLPVIISLFVFPLIYQSMLKEQKIIFKTVNITGYIQTFKKMRYYLSTLIRSSFIGSLAGFVPGITYGLSTILAYSYEKTIEISNGSYKKGSLRCLLAAESANNAGVYTQLIPLLFLGIPITASEALIYNILEFRGLSVTADFFKSTFFIVTGFFLLSSSIGLIIAGKYVNWLKFLQKFSLKYIYIVVFIFLLISVYIIGEKTFTGIDHLIILFSLLPIGYLLKYFDNVPLIYGFVLHEILYSSAVRLYYFHIN